jgi:hypothetical protein
VINLVNAAPAPAVIAVDAAAEVAAPAVNVANPVNAAPLAAAAPVNAVNAAPMAAAPGDGVVNAVGPALGVVAAALSKRMFVPKPPTKVSTLFCKGMYS